MRARRSAPNSEGDLAIMIPLDRIELQMERKGAVKPGRPRTATRERNIALAIAQILDLEHAHRRCGIRVSRYDVSEE
jgi:hypothetical protein